MRLNPTSLVNMALRTPTPRPGGKCSLPSFCKFRLQRSRNPGACVGPGLALSGAFRSRSASLSGKEIFSALLQGLSDIKAQYVQQKRQLRDKSFSSEQAATKSSSVRLLGRLYLILKVRSEKVSAYMRAISSPNIQSAAQPQLNIHSPKLTSLKNSLQTPTDA